MDIVASVAIALLTVALGGVMATILTNHNEHRKWLREQRLSIYSTLVSHSMTVSAGSKDVDVKDIIGALGKMQLIGSDEATSRAMIATDTLGELLTDSPTEKARSAHERSLAAFMVAAQQDLGVKL